MSATATRDPNLETKSAASSVGTHSTVVEFAKCECCGLTEECTLAYMESIRQRNHGSWICGLCGEAVKNELARSERLINTEEALNRHMNFCKKFKSSPTPLPDPTIHLIAAMKQLLRRTLESSKTLRSSPDRDKSPCSIAHAG